LKRPLTMYYCTAAVFRDKPYMYMNGACTPFMYMYTQFMYRRQRCFQGPPSSWSVLARGSTTYAY